MVPNSYDPVRLEGNGILTDFDFDFKVITSADLKVYTVDRDTNETTLVTEGVDYTVTLNTVTEGGTVAFGSAPDDETDVLITRDLELTQDSQLPVGGSFPAKTVENALDRTVMLIQEIFEILDNHILQTPLASDISSTLPSPEALRCLRWNSAENALENTNFNPDEILSGAVSLAITAKNTWASGTSYDQGDVVTYTPGGDVRTAYMSKTNDNVGNQPDISTSDWAEIAEDGSDGADGADGADSDVFVGRITLCSFETPPTKYLECDGSAVSRTTYADLFSAIGTNFGQGDGSTTFNLPDLRGKFPRGWDHGAGNDPNAATRTAQTAGGNTGDHVGSVQGHAYEAHIHTLSIDINGCDDSGGGNENSVSGGDSTNTGSSGGSETRPINVNVMYCIRYEI